MNRIIYTKKYGEEKDVLDKKRHEQIWINKIETHRWSFVWVWRRGRNEVIKSLIKKEPHKNQQKVMWINLTNWLLKKKWA